VSLGGCWHGVTACAQSAQTVAGGTGNGRF
jgi:hypothetical protein